MQAKLAALDVTLTVFLVVTGVTSWVVCAHAQWVCEDLVLSAFLLLGVCVSLLALGLCCRRALRTGDQNAFPWRRMCLYFLAGLVCFYGVVCAYRTLHPLLRHANYSLGELLKYAIAEYKALRAPAQETPVLTHNAENRSERFFVECRPLPDRSTIWYILRKDPDSKRTLVYSYRHLIGPKAMELDASGYLRVHLWSARDASHTVYILDPTACVLVGRDASLQYPGFD